MAEEEKLEFAGGPAARALYCYCSRCCRERDEGEGKRRGKERDEGDGKSKQLTNREMSTSIAEQNRRESE
ncbi:hypothetical protein Dimus_022756 [Dionaea muscipula]